MRWLIVFATWSPFSIAQDLMHVPSSVRVELGGDRQKSFNSAFDLSLSTKDNWQFYAEADYSRIPDADAGDDLISSGASLGFGTDPLDILSSDFRVRSWRMADDVKVLGGELGITYLANSFTVSLQLGGERLKFFNLPRALYPGQEAGVDDRYGTLSIEYYFWKLWSARGYYSHHRYSEDISQFANYAPLALSRFPPSVLTTITSFPDQEGGIDFGYSRKRYAIHIDLGSSRSALDHVRTRRFVASGHFSMSRRWSLGAEIGTSKPENSVEDNSDNRYGSVYGIFSWH